jgi:predicted enzyme related to lactoylglutathione lyase
MTQRSAELTRSASAESWSGEHSTALAAEKLETPNGFVWYELMTTDAEAAMAFYRAVIGWSPEILETPEVRYTVMSAGEQRVAGIMRLPDEACQAGGRPGWVGYIGVSDVDATAERLWEAGGTVHRPPADIPNVGRFAVVADPQGAVFMLFTPLGGDNAPAPAGTPGHVGWRELHAAEGASAFRFYADLFGWTKAEAMDMGPMGTYQLFAAGGEAIGGMMTKTPAMPSPVWLYYFTVERLDPAIGRVTGQGGRILHGPHEVPGGSWIVQCMDPQGAMFALVAPAR